MTAENDGEAVSTGKGGPGTGLIWFVLVLLLAAEGVVLYGVYDTWDKKTRFPGGDIVHIDVDSFEIDIGGQIQTVGRGTYVMTRQGLLRLDWYWFYKYWYVSVPLPLVLVSILLLARRPRGKVALSLR